MEIELEQLTMGESATTPTTTPTKAVKSHQSPEQPTDSFRLALSRPLASSDVKQLRCPRFTRAPEKPANGPLAFQRIAKPPPPQAVGRQSLCISGKDFLKKITSLGTTVKVVKAAANKPKKARSFTVFRDDPLANASPETPKRKQANPYTGLWATPKAFKASSPMHLS